MSGLAANIAAVLGSVDAKTVIVPGHGPLADREDLKRYHAMIVATRNEVKAMQGQGMDLEAIKARGLSAEWEAWGGGFIDEENWISFIFASP